jgi:hypothetical protein
LFLRPSFFDTQTIPSQILGKIPATALSNPDTGGPVLGRSLKETVVKVEDIYLMKKKINEKDKDKDDESSVC